ncbi:dynein assembly factor 5, axonemal-like [Pollicipes pollicipes]|uniref:dynein assembly factor 5, axonemal-like n=1 Tax=Pollicipes pollicipes TaxID=41117 RepID=UPI00188495A7|nr:dynein assembly factor 5, axonemal-like [Pollicipes pollicipes]
MPSIVWHPGRSDAAIRTAAISCLHTELKVPEITASVITGDLEKLVTLVTGLLEEEDRRTRLLALRCLSALSHLPEPGTLPVQLVHTSVTELLKRLDDTDAEVRQTAAATFPALVSALGPDYSGEQWRGHVEHFARTLLVFLDDTDEALQERVYEALLAAGHLNTAVVCEQASVERDRQRSPTRCDRLLRHWQ